MLLGVLKTLVGFVLVASGLESVIIVSIVWSLPSESLSPCVSLMIYMKHR